MPVARCRYDAQTEEVRVDGGGSLWIGEDGDLIGSSGAVGTCSLSSLRTTLSRAVGNEVGVTLYDAPERELRLDEESFAGAVSLTFAEERVLLNCLMDTERGERFNRDELGVRLSAALARNRLRIRALSSYDERVYGAHYLTLEILGRGRTLNDAAEASDDVHALWHATAGGDLAPATVVDFLRAQRPELLVGTPESSWLEVKRSGYALERVDQQFELVKDVAAIANTENGGLLILGLATSKANGRDVISRYQPLDPKNIDPRSYRRVIETRLYPRPQGLTVERIETGPEEALLLISIPGQPPENQPVLVRGVLAGGATLGHHVGLFRREGDQTVWTDPTALHSLIAAGRAALAAGLSQPSSPDQAAQRPL